MRIFKILLLTLCTIFCLLNVVALPMWLITPYAYVACLIGSIKFFGVFTVAGLMLVAVFRFAVLLVDEL